MVDTASVSGQSGCTIAPQRLLQSSQGKVLAHWLHIRAAASQNYRTLVIMYLPGRCFFVPHKPCCRCQRRQHGWPSGICSGSCAYGVHSMTVSITCALHPVVGVPDGSMAGPQAAATHGLHTANKAGQCWSPTAQVGPLPF